MTARRQYRLRGEELGSKMSLAGYVALQRDMQIPASIRSARNTAGGYDFPPLCCSECLRSDRPPLSNSADRLLELPVGCFPPASPAIAAEAGKHRSRKAGPRGQLILLRKIGAGEGIRTLDPDLGKILVHAP
jgi:hypothetical protein